MSRIAPRPSTPPVLLLAVALAWGCTTAPPAEREPHRPSASEPTLADTPASPGAQAAGARLLSTAREALEAGQYREARRAAEVVVADYRGTPGSGGALWIAARAALELDDPAAAARAASAYADLLPPDDERAVRARLLEARARLAAGAPEEAVGTLLGLSPEGRARPEARKLAEEAVQELSTEALGRLVERTEGRASGPIPAVVLAEYALGRFLDGAVGEARMHAREVRDAGTEGRARAVAEAVLAGDVAAFAPVRPVLGAVLPRSGSPGVRRAADMIHEGVRVALEGASGRHQRAVRLVEADQAGDVGVELLIRRMEEDGALGVVGPLMERVLERAASARRTPMPIISPTARMTPPGAPGVYSLGGVDPAAVAGLARYARRTGVGTVVIVHPDTEASRVESEAFTETFQELGGRVLRRIPFQPGTTDFREPMEAARALSPDALFLPLQERDVELVAPAVAYYGLEEEGIRVLGSSAFASPVVLRRVDPRHTEGVVAVVPRRSRAAAEARDRFVSEYEALFQKSLRNDLPALGYDAARLLLEAYEGGARRPDEVLRRLERIEGFPGATGILSVRDGRIVREHRLVRIEAGELIPLEDLP